MQNNDRSTQLKVASGYILLTVLLFVSVGYIFHEMKSLTGTTNDETILSQRRHMTNQIIGQLYEASIIGQSLSTGQLEEYFRYQQTMKQANQALDSLRGLLTDSVQLARLDTVRRLFIDKEVNMRNLLLTIQNGGTDQMYQAHMDTLIAQQDSLLNLSHVRKKVVTHTNSYVIHKKKKGFFKRLGEVFVPGKEDSTHVQNVIQEEYTDTITEAFNPVDTVASLLKDIQRRVHSSHQEQLLKINQRTQNLRLIGLRLSQKVNQLLNTIEEEEQALAEQKSQQEEQIRRDSARTVAGIAIVAVILAIAFLVFIWRDITRSVHYRNELEKAKRRAEDLLVAREKLMLTITHDIKAPVGSILGYIDLLERITHEERQRFYLDNMQSSANHLLSLVKSLLDFHRLDAHKMEVRPIAFNPQQLFDTIYISFKPMAAAKQLELHYDCSIALNRVYTGDPFRIRQIAENLLSNALKFTAEGSITLHVYLQGDQLFFSIRDTGCGISGEEQQRIFQEFTRLHSAQGQEGFGLGLAITRKLVQLLGGEITLESEAGQGSCFRVHLPLPKATELETNETTAPADAALSAPATSPTGSPHSADLEAVEEENNDPIRLLMIDDDRIQLQLTTAMLDHPGIQVVGCQFPEELFTHLKKQTFDILLTDIQMPALNGFELLKVLRQQQIPGTLTLPVIALTARSDMDEAYFLQHGFAGCLHKPFTQQELLDAIVVAVGRPLPSGNPQADSTASDASEKENNEGILWTEGATGNPTDGQPDPPLNFASLTAFSADDPEAAKEIIRTFLSETEKNRQRMQTALEAGQMTEITESAHKLLPLFTMLNAVRCVSALTWMEERRGTTELTNEAREKTRFVLQEVDRVLEEGRKHAEASNQTTAEETNR